MKEILESEKQPMGRKELLGFLVEIDSTFYFIILLFFSYCSITVYLFIYLNGKPLLGPMYYARLKVLLF